MTTFYLDSSVALRGLFGDSSVVVWLRETSALPDVRFVASRLTRTEITRVLRREGLPVVLRDEVLQGMELVPVTDDILAAAEAIETAIRALDAIHLASAMATGLDPLIVTHDRTMKRLAVDLGYGVVDPVAG